MKKFAAMAVAAVLFVAPAGAFAGKHYSPAPGYAPAPAYSQGYAPAPCGPVCAPACAPACQPSCGVCLPNAFEVVGGVVAGVGNVVSGIGCGISGLFSCGY